jgi:ATP-dependent RNA helicase DDX56/DBP9
MENSFLETSSDMQAALTNLAADSSVMKAAIKLKYKYPTLVQNKLFELSQERNHIVIKSKARSGKTSGALLLALHKMIQNIKESGKKAHFAVIICPNKAVCNSNEALLEKMISFSKETYDIAYLNLTKTSYEIFENEMYLEAKKRLIIIGTPVLFKKMLLSVPHPDNIQQNIETIFLDELNFMFSFGYETDLHELLSSYTDKAEGISIIFSLSNEDERIKALKSLIMKNSVTIKFNEQTDEGEEDEETSREMALHNEFFYISDDVTKYICLYILFKLKLIAGRTLILCKDIDEVYKVNAFLERCQIKTSKVYNSEWPLKVRQYFLSLFNTSLINIMVSTSEILELGKQSPKNKGGLREMDNIIVTDLNIIIDMYEKVPRFLNARRSIPCLIEFLEPDDESKELLFTLLERAKAKRKTTNMKELPVTSDQIDSFKYRCTDIYKGITRKQINTLKTMDVKKQLLKSKELKGYFDEHRKERELIVDNINRLSQEISHRAITMEDSLPSYLLENEETKTNLDNEESTEPKYKKIVKQRFNEEYETSLAKRMASNNLTLDDVKKKRKMEGDKYMTVNQSLEDPLITDPSRLTPMSNKKLWKLRHKISLKKVNKRLMKKGIFES